MSFWSDYRASLRSLDVEEPIDLWAHRRLGYVIARLALPTSLSPNHVTVASVVMGGVAGACFASPFPQNLPIGALCLFLSTVLDCADGQLARLRRSPSADGRMLDGVADGVTLLAATAGTTVALFRMYSTPLCHGLAVVALAALTVLTSALHTAGYDHYKNLYLRLTCPDAREGEDLEAARSRSIARRAGPIGSRTLFVLYLGYLSWQRAFLGWFDPHTVTRLDLLPGFNADRAAIYKGHALAPMRLWRSLFGVGSLAFGLALLNALGRPDVFVAFRLLILNAVFWLYLRPMQRAASAGAFQALAQHARSKMRGL